MKLAILALACLALTLTGCGGDFASPTTTTTAYQTRTTTTVMSQDHGKAVCIGMLNLGSCNTVQVNTQAPAAYPSNAAELGGGLLLIMASFFVVFVGACFALGTREGC